MMSQQSYFVGRLSEKKQTLTTDIISGGSCRAANKNELRRQTSLYLFIKLNFCVLLCFDGRQNSFQNRIEFCGFENFFSIVALSNWIEFYIIFLSIKMRLDSNIESKSSNNPYFNIIKIFNKLSLGDICVANFIPPCEWCESR